MKIKDYKLIDLYRRLSNFIISTYPDALIIENENNVVITYPGELGRIVIFQNEEQKFLLVKVLLEIGQKITNQNSKTFYLSSIDELNCLKTGVQVVMEMKNSNFSESKVATTARTGQGYLLDTDKNLVGVVDLDLIPTNAFVRDVDIENKQTEIMEEAPPKEKTIYKFFRR